MNRYQHGCNNFSLNILIYIMPEDRRTLKLTKEHLVAGTYVLIYRFTSCIGVYLWYNLYLFHLVGLGFPALDVVPSRS